MFNERLPVILDDSDRLMDPEVYLGMYSLLLSFLKGDRKLFFVCLLVFIIK